MKKSLFATRELYSRSLDVSVLDECIIIPGDHAIERGFRSYFQGVKGMLLKKMEE